MFEAIPAKHLTLMEGKNGPLSPQEIELQSLEAALSDPHQVSEVDKHFFFQTGGCISGSAITPDAHNDRIYPSLGGSDDLQRSVYSKNMCSTLETPMEGLRGSDIIETIMSQCFCPLEVDGPSPNLPNINPLDRAATSMIPYCDKLKPQDSTQGHENVSLFSCLDIPDHPWVVNNSAACDSPQRKTQSCKTLSNCVKQEDDVLKTETEEPYLCRSRSTSTAKCEDTISTNCSPISQTSSNCRTKSLKADDSVTPVIRAHVQTLREKIEKMPRRKLRESLAATITIEDVEPLMNINRDDVASLLGIGVTTWKAFVHKTLGIARWPARGIKSLQSREKSLRARMCEAQEMQDVCTVREIKSELSRLQTQREIDRARRRSMAEGRRRQALRSHRKAV